MSVPGMGNYHQRDGKFVNTETNQEYEKKPVLSWDDVRNVRMMIILKDEQHVYNYIGYTIKTGRSCLGEKSRGGHPAEYNNKLLIKSERLLKNSIHPDLWRTLFNFCNTLDLFQTSRDKKERERNIREWKVQIDIPNGRKIVSEYEKEHDIKIDFPLPNKNNVRKMKIYRNHDYHCLISEIKTHGFECVEKALSCSKKTLRKWMTPKHVGHPVHPDIYARLQSLIHS